MCIIYHFNSLEHNSVALSTFTWLGNHPTIAITFPSARPQTLVIWNHSPHAPLWHSCNHGFFSGDCLFWRESGHSYSLTSEAFLPRSIRLWHTSGFPLESWVLPLPNHIYPFIIHHRLTMVNNDAIFEHRHTDNLLNYFHFSDKESKGGCQLIVTQVI